MAMVHCPECNKEISDKAENCPSCGYVLIKNELPKIRKSELSEIKKNSVMGAVWIVVGAICVLVGIPLITIIIGIFAIFAGLIFIGMGISKLSGTQTGTCPYCNNSIAVGTKAATLKCPHCKKTSTRKDGYLETIE